MKEFLYRLLEVDLGAGSTSIRTIDPGTIGRFIGGSGLAARLLWKDGPVDPDPFSPEVPLFFMTGPLTGTPVTSSGRYSVAGRSPLTGFWGEANVGGSWGTSLRKAGVDGLRVVGRAAKPVYLWITPGRAEIRDASHLWGADTFDTQALIQRETHPRVVVSCIGPAGERGVRIASVMTDGHHARAAGRCGLGAVMGSKNLKAIAVWGDRGIPVLKRKELLTDLREIMQSFRERTAALHMAGTSGLVLPQEELGSFPIKNYAQDRWPEGARRISWPAMEESIFVRNYRCAGCVIACGRTVGVDPRNDPKAGLTAGPEYETLALLGSNLLIGDIRAVQQMNELCNRLGIDTIEAGSLIGFAMEIFERGLLPPDLTGGVEPRWGDAEGAFEIIRQMGESRALGAFLAEGYHRVLEALHPDAAESAMQVKGLGLPAHDPRAYNSVALGYATSNRGACHLQGFTHVFEINVTEPALGLHEIADRFGTDKGRMVADIQDLMAIYDSLTICKFNLFGGVKLPRLARWFEMVTGIPMSPSELKLAGERIFNTKRLLNAHWGLTRSMDTLPARMLAVAKKEGPSSGNLPPLKTMLEQYYAARGWDDSGKPDEDTRRRLGI